MILLPHLYLLPLNPKPGVSPRRHGFRCLCRPIWGTNAESFRRGKFDQRNSDESRGIEEEEVREGFGREEKRRWWSDTDSNDYDSDDDFDFDLDDGSIWDKIWIFKVFKSYGYFLPVIIGSMLVTTGPKAFLMALALPLGQSAISFAIDSIWGRKTRDKPRPKTKWKRPVSRSNGGEERGRGGNKKGSYRTWVSGSQGGVNDKSGKVGFGGWDEFDRERGNAYESYEKGEKVTKLSKRGRRYKEVPLFMRLLVAVFPFLGSWFRL